MEETGMRVLQQLVALMLVTSCLLHAKSPPNVIVIITDDQGYGDLSCHGNPFIRTPHLDQLHRESIRLTDFHVAPMCTPTRGQLMTGIDCLRNGAMNVSSGRTLLRREFSTLPEMLRDNGLATGLFGKWHLGDNYPFRPQDRGFDEAIWFPSSHIGSVPDHWMNDYFDDTYLTTQGSKVFPGYTTEVFFSEAMKWMRRQKEAGKPFFTYLATAAPHSPLFVPKTDLETTRNRLDSKRAEFPKLNDQEWTDLLRFLAMIENIDAEFGKLESFLKQEGLYENTIVVFLTDNGSTMGEKYFNAGMRGKKVTLWEGGHRVPCFIRWPMGGLPAGRDVTELTQVQDLLPTVLDLLGMKVPSSFDGMSLKPLLLGESSALPDRKLVIHYSRMPGTQNPLGVEPTRDGAAVLWGRWRLLESKALYDVRSDPMQQRDVASQHPDVVREMTAHLDAWWNGVKDRVNEPSRLIIGSAEENPMLLTACEWWNVFVDQQGQVRRGERKNSLFHLEVAEAGDYEIELRRWPREAKLPLHKGLPAAKVEDGWLAPGIAIPIHAAALEIAGQTLRAEATEDAQHITFRLPLTKGPTTLEATFLNAAGEPLLGAYYLYIKKH
jgi:arylsulfatase A-like enzyme